MAQTAATRCPGYGNTALWCWLAVVGVQVVLLNFGRPLLVKVQGLHRYSTAGPALLGTAPCWPWCS
jgi:hypothetical protein